MKTMTLREAREDFDAVVSAGREAPVEIVRDGERVGLFLCDADVELIEDILLSQRLEATRAEGTIGIAASRTLLDRVRGAED